MQAVETLAKAIAPYYQHYGYMYVLIDRIVGFPLQEDIQEALPSGVEAYPIFDPMLAETPERSLLLLKIPLSQVDILAALLSAAEYETKYNSADQRAICFFFASAETPENIVAHFQRWLDALVIKEKEKTPEEKKKDENNASKWLSNYFAKELGLLDKKVEVVHDYKGIYFRFYEPRNLSNLATILTKEQLADLFGKFDCLFFIGLQHQQFKWETLALDQAEAQQLTQPVLTAEQWRLLGRTQVYVMAMRNIEFYHAEQEPGVSLSLEKLVMDIPQYNLPTLHDEAWFAAYHWKFGDQFIKHPNFKKLIEEVSASGLLRLRDAIEQDLGLYFRQAKPSTSQNEANN